MMSVTKFAAFAGTAVVVTLAVTFAITQIMMPAQRFEACIEGSVAGGKNIHVYSFALKPEEHQPSGTLNMSRIDSATLDLEYASGAAAAGDMVSVYAVNYNVLRILSGMGGIAYSN